MMGVRYTKYQWYTTLAAEQELKDREKIVSFSKYSCEEPSFMVNYQK